MNPATKARSLTMRALTSDTLLAIRRGVPACRRRLARRPPEVHYFHQVGDPYSHLIVQKLDRVWQRYRVRVSRHLVSGPDTPYKGDPDQFDTWAAGDARSVAPFYGVELPGSISIPPSGVVTALQNELAGLLASPEFERRAAALGNAMWAGTGPKAPKQTALAARALESGDRLLRRLGHYQGGMLYFEGEWYWGLDRLHHLEKRLQMMGLDSLLTAALCVPRPIAESATGASTVTLEYFPSLRSPYTAISYTRTMDLVDRSGVTLDLRPVMPMMMRGIPAPLAKQFYIITDSKREADAAGVPFGKGVDPIGKAVHRAFSLYPWMEQHGKARDYVGSYLSAVFAEGIDVTRDAGLARVVTRIGVDWASCREALGSEEYIPLLDTNLRSLNEAGLWGVPSFRVTGGSVDEAFCCWGQDRLWRVETEITRRAQ